MTGTGSVLGTAQYLSPEQASSQVVTPASDLYSVGVLLFQMLAGAVAFTDESPVVVALRHVKDEVPSVHDFAPDVPRWPRQRYADAAQMEAALRNAVAAHGAAAATSVLPAAAAAPGGLLGSWP
jgi:eukaryotic-like serine/threonine-protein kinase